MCQGCVGDLFEPIKNLRADFSRREFLGVSAIAAGALVGSFGLRAPAAAASGADTIFYGGTIVPMTGLSTTVEAMAVSGKKIAAIGSLAETRTLQTSMTRMVNLDGRTLLPGFIDPHQHPLTGALLTTLFADVGYQKFRTREAVLGAIRAEVAKKPTGSWTYLMNYDNLLQGGELLMSDLDAISTTKPIMVYYINMHTASANGAAFRAAKIAADAGDLPDGGHFGRGADGKHDGMIYESSALKPFLAGLPAITPEFAGKALLGWLALNAKAGNTMVHEPGVLAFGDLLGGYEAIARTAPTRTSISLFYDSLATGEQYRAHGIGARATQLPESNLSLYGIKIVCDGSNQTKGAAQTVSYLHTSENGQTNFDTTTLNKMVADVRAAGWPVSIHANGDAAVDSALDAIASAYGANPETGINRIEHCTITRPEQILRMKELGVQPSFLMNHVYFYGAAYRDTLFGPERANRMDPAAECVALGLPFTLHTDAPCSNIGTLQLIQTAVTRQCATDGSVIGPEQAISVHDALKAVTVYAAAQVGMADRLGTLERGKEADLTILEDNPYTVDPNKIMDIVVSETWVAGKKIAAA